MSLKLPAAALGDQMREIFQFPASFHVQEDPEGEKQCELEKKSIHDALSTCESEFRETRCISNFEHRVRLAAKYLRPRLNPHLTECAAKFAEGSDRKLVIHLRGSEGRDFNAETHSCHEQPWCSYYDLLLEKSKDELGKVLYDQVLVVGDSGNPCRAHLEEKHGKRKDLSLSFTDGSLFSDACALLGAKHVAWGRSAFSALFMTLNPNRDSVFVPLVHSNSSCSAWNLNRGVCSYVKRGLFWKPPEWELVGHDDRFAGECESDTAKKKKKQVKTE